MQGRTSEDRWKSQEPSTQTGADACVHTTGKRLRSRRPASEDESLSSSSPSLTSKVDRVYNTPSPPALLAPEPGPTDPPTPGSSGCFSASTVGKLATARTGGWSPGTDSAAGDDGGREGGCGAGVGGACCA
ncbi:hypothetical protein DIPPA_01982 [Diplonema papillatum]|nr:hypothetical protein DIPPA_01982 [Diplonema papillatum]